MNHINTNRLYATIRSWPIIFIIFALVNFGFMMAFTTQANASGPSPPVCGNGAKESGEACDLGAGNGQPSSCCTSTCTYVAAGTVCRPKATGTECDVAETCPGNKDDCPVDRFEASSVLCGSTPVGLCDLQDKCQGQNVGPNCVDLVRDNQYDCRPSAGVCDLVETCDGMSKTCPPDSKSTAVCRPAAGECDLAESCDGGNNCPADVKKTNMTACDDDGNDCTLDQCNGTNVNCQHPAKAAGLPCGSLDSSECDDADTCNGNGACLDNNKQNNTDCGDGGTDCTNQDKCLNGVCDDKGFKNSGVPCDDDGNECTDNKCDGSGTCEAISNTDPCDDELFCTLTDACSDGSCVGEGNPCDGGDECNDTCDDDNDNCFVGAGTPCTDDGNVCTDNECDGSGTCEAINNTEPCDDELFCTLTDTCSDGSCVGSGDPCEGGDECNNSCNEGDETCYTAANTDCGDPNDTECDKPDKCDGKGLCLDNYEPVTTTCEDAGDECVNQDYCDGAGGCTDNGFVAVTTPCGDPTDSDCTDPDECDGGGLCDPKDVADCINCCGGVGGDCRVNGNCTSGECTGGGVAPVNTPCGDGTDDDCKNPDTCDGSGDCLDRDEGDGTACTDTDGLGCTMAACEAAECNQEYTSTCISGCRGPGFFGSHAGTEKPKSKNITQEILGLATDGKIMVCGRDMDDTDVDSASSAVEALCLSKTAKQGQLARQIAVAKLNLVVNGLGPDDLEFINACDMVCEDSNSTIVAIQECIDAIEDFNNGRSALAPDCNMSPLPGFNPTGPAGSSTKCSNAAKTRCTFIFPGWQFCSTIP